MVAFASSSLKEQVRSTAVTRKKKLGIFCCYHGWGGVWTSCMKKPSLHQETLHQETLHQETLHQETLHQETLHQETLISRNLHIKKSKLCAQSSADKNAHEEDVFESNPGEGSLHPVRVPREERREEGLPAGPGHQGGGAAPGCHQRECRGRSAARCPRRAATSACTAGGVPRGVRGGVQQHQPSRAPQEECREVRGSFLHFLQILSSSCQNITGERRGSLSEYKIISSQVPEDSTNCLYFPCILS